MLNFGFTNTSKKILAECELSRLFFGLYLHNEHQGQSKKNLSLSLPRVQLWVVESQSDVQQFYRRIEGKTCKCTNAANAFTKRGVNSKDLFQDSVAIADMSPAIIVGFLINLG